MYIICLFVLGPEMYQYDIIDIHCFVHTLQRMRWQNLLLLICMTSYHAIFEFLMTHVGKKVKIIEIKHKAQKYKYCRLLCIHFLFLFEAFVFAPYCVHITNITLHFQHLKSKYTIDTRLCFLWQNSWIALMVDLLKNVQQVPFPSKMLTDSCFLSLSSKKVSVTKLLISKTWILSTRFECNSYKYIVVVQCTFYVPIYSHYYFDPKFYGVILLYWSTMRIGKKSVRFPKQRHSSNVKRLGPPPFFEHNELRIRSWRHVICKQSSFF